MRKIENIGVVGCGLIGMSWTSLFLAQGYKVQVVEPNIENQDALQPFIEEAWPLLTQLGLVTVGKIPEVPIFKDVSELKDIDFVQENVADRIEVKHQVIAALEKVLDQDVIIASSTSSLKATDIQSQASHPGRIAVGHPMNPPHMIPMVEIVAGERTSEQTILDLECFYKACKRVTIKVKKEVIGHLANRLTSALYREAVYIAEQGIATVEDIDKAIAYGPGMRWALMGPHLTYHLGGGKGGYQHYLEHLGPTQEARWQDQGTPKLTPQLKAALVAGVEKELEQQDGDTLIQRRDQALVEICRLKQKFGL
ncbi:MAG: 3-hydroxyacyl-CoA dehydrogenase NAD-binding domain-containing protein [Oceanospirillaceae bacterium]